MDTVKIIGIYDPGKTSFAQDAIAKATGTDEEFTVVYYLHDKKLKKIHKKDIDNYVPIHVPKDAIVAFSKTETIEVENSKGELIVNDKYEIALNKFASCFVFKHPKSNSMGSTKHEVSILLQSIVDSLINPDFTIKKDRLEITDTKYELNGTDTKPPCHVPSELVP